MDPTVPAPAARLLDFVRDTEVGTEARSGYDVIYGFNQNKLDKPVTSMTVAQVQSQQRSWSKQFGSSATGAYQFMHATLGDLRKQLGLRDSQKLDPDLQDRLAYHLLKRRGYEEFMAGDISRSEFGKRLAQEWASFPVLARTQGAHRRVERNQSYYAGDKLNRALVDASEIERVLDEVREIASEPPEPVSPPQPQPRPQEPQIESGPEIGASGYPIYTPKPGENIVAKPSPVQQVSKALGGAKGSAQGLSFAGGLVILLAYAGIIPPGTGPTEMALISTAATAVVTPLWSFVQGYLSPRNAE